MKHEPQSEPYACTECGFHYRDKEWAEKCEEWCKENKSCNIEIMSHSTESQQTREEEGKKGAEHITKP